LDRRLVLAPRNAAARSERRKTDPVAKQATKRAPKQPKAIFSVRFTIPLLFD
jgi:hypothetical protein